MSMQHWTAESIARRAIERRRKEARATPKTLTPRLVLLHDLIEELAVSWVRMLWGLVFGMFVIGAALLLVPELLGRDSTLLLTLLFLLAFTNIAGPVLVRALVAPRVWSEEGLEAISPVSVLANVPEMSSEAARERRRQDRVRLVTLALATLTAGMFLMVVY